VSQRRKTPDTEEEEADISSPETPILGGQRRKRRKSFLLCKTLNSIYISYI
jgi:hypothetical protein